jgi:lysophospholipase L1-like esterase
VQKVFEKKTDKIFEYDIYKDLREEYSYLNKMHNEAKIVFVGDSITKRFNIQEFAGDCRIINRAVFFDTTQGLLDRIDVNVNNLNVDIVFLMIGYNDLKFRSDDEIVSNIKLIVSRLKSNTIYIQSLLPVGFDSPDLNNRIVYINNQIMKISNNKNIIYLDLHSYFIASGNYIKPELTRDGVHPNYFGYKLWYSIIDNLL